jgi:uncharacterized protein (DUF697 family)
MQTKVEQPASDETETKLTLEEASDETIRYHVYGSIATGLIPVPVVDFLGIASIQLNLLKNLSELYEIPFSKDIVKNLIGALVGATVPSLYLSSLVKFIPVVGLGTGAVSTSVIAAASTYAIGKVFNRHFSEGGTFLTFDPEKARVFYREMFKEGQQVATEAAKNNQ